MDVRLRIGCGAEIPILAPFERGCSNNAGGLPPNRRVRAGATAMVRARAAPARPRHPRPARALPPRRRVREEVGRRHPASASRASEKDAAQELGFPAFATKNTTRVGGARPGRRRRRARRRRSSPPRTPATQPHAVALVDKNDWRAGIAAGLLMSGSLRAPILLTDGDKIPTATQDALDALAPKGAKTAGGAQVIRVGDAPQARRSAQRPDRRRATRSPWRAAIDRFSAAADRRSSDRVIVVSSAAPRVRDAGRRLGREGRRPGALRPPRRHPRPDTGGDRLPPAAEDLRPRARRRWSASAVVRAAAEARHRDAHLRGGPGRQLDRLRALRRRVLRLGRRRPGPRPARSPTRSARSTPPRRRRSRPAAATARC